MITAITTRIQSRMRGEQYDTDIMAELAQEILDRLSLRLGVTAEASFPSVFYSVVVDATVKAWRRKYYEGISSENAGNLSTSFFEDILEEYEPEIASYLGAINPDDENAPTGKVVRFL